jgi:MerR family transcriptional regulator, copper efflux regulator
VKTSPDERTAAFDKFLDARAQKSFTRTGCEFNIFPELAGGAVDVQPVLIGKLASLSGVTICAVRVYERKGLIKPLYRARNGYRYYDASLQYPIRVFSAALSLGLSLSEIGEIFATAKPLQCEPTASQARASTIVARRIYERHLATIDQEVARLMGVRALLEQRVAHTSAQLSGSGPVRIAIPASPRERRNRPGRVEYIHSA